MASQQLMDAEQLIADENWPKALSALSSIIDAKSFSKLGGDFQYKVLMISARTALEHGAPQLAYGYLVRATSMPQATIGDWFARLRAAGASQSLELKWRLVGALLSREHYDAALAASDSVFSDLPGRVTHR
jgi:hypothetical protein